LSNLEQVTKDDVQRVAKKYLAETNRTVGWFIPTNDGTMNMPSRNGKRATKSSSAKKKARRA